MKPLSQSTQVDDSVDVRGRTMQKVCSGLYCEYESAANVVMLKEKVGA